MKRRGYIEESGAMQWLITACDIVLVVISMLAAYSFYQQNDTAVNDGVDIQTYIVVAVMCYVPLSIYMPPILLGRVVRIDKIVERVFQKTVLLLILVTSVLFLLKFVAIARTLLLSFSIAFLILLFVERLVFRYIVRMFRRSGRNQQNVILVGQTDDLSELCDHMRRKEYGYRIYGYFTNSGGDLPEGVECKGGISDVVNFLQENPHINAVYCAMSQTSKEELLQIYQYCENHVIRFFALPMYLPYLRKNMTLTQIGATMLLSPRTEPLQDLGNRVIKRSFDIVVSLFALLTFYPVVYLAVLVFVKRQSPGPVYFTQKRSGLNGRDFDCIKFRSMHVNEQSDVLQATEDDPRKFPFGDFMRRMNIDELPQLINVLKGDMSLVGPRPHMLLHTEEYSRIINKYMVRHWVKPGITGWAQVNGFRGETKELNQMEERVRNDIWYVENWSFWLDVRILWRTIWNMIKHNEKNAY